jgi:hypothetical protein
MSRLQSDVSGGKAAKKGSATRNVGDKAGPQAAIVDEMTAQFKQANFAGVRGDVTGAKSKAARGHASGATPTYARKQHLGRSCRRVLGLGRHQGQLAGQVEGQNQATERASRSR